MKIPVLFGPTAVGKPDLVLKLCETYPIEVISMDSMQIYRQMDIGTAKPSKEVLAVAKHWMIDILDPQEEYNAYRYRSDALKAIEDVRSRDKIPLVVGGTGLYLDALIHGLFEGVSKDEGLRRELRKTEENNPGYLRAFLKEADPESYARIHPNDIKRTIRALEVYLLSGKTLSTAQKDRVGDERFLIVECVRGREELYSRIDARVDAMIQEGLLEETRALLEQGCTAQTQSMKAIGYRESIQFLQGLIPTKEQYRHRLKVNTHHYARRQIIWGRKYARKTSCDLSTERFGEKEQKGPIIIERLLEML
ncbi:MAG TPA: tRNA (adenosine(37)-N6)-dimethylallyltransferase MiaA [Thermotogota bacterium]|nr:tRNA (adenosine(37)-N6)-dimethylallyltransferase MiaA [Thermotogota bacterium]